VRFIRAWIGQGDVERAEQLLRQLLGAMVVELYLTKLNVVLWAHPHRGVGAQVRPPRSQCHTIRVEAAAARLTMMIENVPSEENPRTGKITPLSILACLRGLTSTLKVGS
jgi:predicted dinucleotide-utilizing enzyme